MACLRHPSLRLPGFALCPEGALSKLLQLFGAQDIAFPDHPRFSRSYVLRGVHEPSVREVFSQEVLDYFDRKPGMWLEGGLEWLVFYRPGERLWVRNYPRFVREAREVLEQFTSRILHAPPVPRAT